MTGHERAPISFRLKLTLWFLLIFAGVQLALMSAAWAIRQASLDRFRSHRLALWADAAAHRLERLDPPWDRDALRLLLASDPDFVFALIRTSDGSIHAASDGVDPAAAPPLVRPRAGRGTTTFVPPDAAERLTGRGQRLRLATSPVKTPSGREFYIQLAAGPDFLGDLPTPALTLFVFAAPVGILAAGIAGWFLAGRAVAPLKDIAAKARRVSATTLDARFDLGGTDDEFDRVREELNSALARLETAYRAQERFIGHVAHDLKTPIAVMLAESQVLRSSPPTVEQYEGFRESIEEEMRRLSGMVEAFLTLARAEQGQALSRLEPLSVNDLVLESTAQCAAEAAQYETRIVPTLIDPSDHEEDPTVIGDWDLLLTMLGNIVRNAIHYSPAGELVAVTAGCTNEHAFIRVRDRGPGIPEDFINRIFDRFLQAPGWSRHHGMGLGLAIARSAAEAHGGDISVRNHPDGGCEFTVELPIRASAPADAAPGEHAAPPVE